jgi:tripartite-type tricarboxylate transporter receptor subunit TctC
MRILINLLNCLSILFFSNTTYAAKLDARFPSRPVRILVGYAPGGGVDMAARLVGQALSDHWGSSVVIDNRPWAGGGIATELTAKSNKDGYTMMLCNIGTHGITPATSKKLPYDYLNDFSFISRIGGNPNLIMAYPLVSIRSISDLIANAKSNPGKLIYGSSSVSALPHLSVELLKLMTGINITHASYKGAALALADVMGGQIPLSVGNLPGGPLSAIKSGKVRGLAVTTTYRSLKLPEVPTVAESGLTNYEVSGWYGICSSRLNSQLEAKLNQDLVKVLNSSALKQKLDDQGIDILSSTPEEFRIHVKTEVVKWKKVIKEAKLEYLE